MKHTIHSRSRNHWQQKILRLLNLRPEEGERTFLMFAFYTTTAVGMLWFEQTATALFLDPDDGFGSKWLPIIYIASSAMGSGLGFLYSWLQNNFPLKKVFIAIAVLMVVPLLIFRTTIEIPYLNGIIVLATVFILRLWIDAQDILNDLNTQVAANQLFNIREIKRAYPLISSGLLLGDVIAGFSLPLLLLIIGLRNVMLTSAVMILVGAIILFYLSGRYKQAFPDTPVKEIEELSPTYTSRSTSSSLKRYIIPLFAFFILGEVLYLLVEFQYLGELETALKPEQIAGFLGIFSGVLGLFELGTQLFVSSRAVERLGAFVAAMFLPISLSLLGFITLILDKSLGFTPLTSGEIILFGAVVLKFFDELLRYTLIAGIQPFLFQPLPSEIRNSIQAKVQGIAVPITTGVTGLAILAGIWLIGWLFPEKNSESLQQLQGGIFIGAIVGFSGIWALSAWQLRDTYLTLLVEGAEQGRLGFNSVDLKAFKKAILEAFEEKETEGDKRSCIQLLERIDPENAGEVLAPLLVNLSPALQIQSLEAMLRYPNSAYRRDVEKLIETQPKPPLDVLALGLRYIWLSQSELDTNGLNPYLNDRVDPVVRGTAASLIVNRGNSQEKIEATNTLKRMLTSERERERIIGTQALQDIKDSSFIQLYIPELLKDDSARVRCALLDVIGSKHLKAYYPSLVKGLYYKSTRESAKKALVGMKNEALSLLMELAEDIHKPDFVRTKSWTAMAEIGTEETLKELVKQLMTSWGISRRNILRILLRMPDDTGIELLLDELGRSGLETLIDQELLLLGQIYGAFLDLKTEAVPGEEADLLREALEGLQSDILERCFLMMKLLYGLSTIQAAMLNLDSNSNPSIALGLEILDNTIELSQKQLFLEILEGGLVIKIDKLAAIDSIVPYEPMAPSSRLDRLIELRHFLSDWSLACCFHVCRAQRWSVTREAALSCLCHPSSFVREAVLLYLREASPRICQDLLPVLKNDPDPLVAAQVEQMKYEFSMEIS
ncbi:MAG: MFS transporter [Moorea sp. SIO2B7]|nr:MFS transporter [Moorena sp. SIO2B7]